MRLVIISDTHGFHNRLSIPAGDVLIHCGDFSAQGKERDLISFVQWLSKLPHSIKIVVAGNHDEQLEKQPELADLFGGVAEYLFNSGTEVDGMYVWGSPFQPWFNNWSFNLDRDSQELRENWEQVPDHTDILITHSPPYGILDKNTEGQPCGCELLRERIWEVKPKLSVFGHIHEGYSMDYWSLEGTTFVNASTCNGRYEPINPPVVIDL